MDRLEIAGPVGSRLEEFHSPDEIAGWMKRFISDPRQRISADTIYRWIHAQPRGTWRPEKGTFWFFGLLTDRTQKEQA